jgi:hypothetical protein
MPPSTRSGQSMMSNGPMEGLVVKRPPSVKAVENWNRHAATSGGFASSTSATVATSGGVAGARS